jgi:hypothetical protein
MCAGTSRLRQKVCTHVEDPCVWVLRVGVALESKVDAACVRTAKEEGPTGIFPYVVREGTRQRKDVPYVGTYRSGTVRVAPNLAIKGWGPVPRKWWSGRRGIGGPRKCTNWTSSSQSLWYPKLAARALHYQFWAPGSVNRYLRWTYHWYLQLTLVTPPQSLVWFLFVFVLCVFGFFNNIFLNNFLKFCNSMI